MNRIQERLAKHRVITYCIVTFALTWSFWFAAVYPRALPLMEAGKSVFSDSVIVMLVGAGMFFQRWVWWSRVCLQAKVFTTCGLNQCTSGVRGNTTWPDGSDPSP